ncbi:DUF2059 domain-containing protein [Sphingomonas corticis]|jgi:hypothetical protein|uniref:DUF2059 domain-containing protein n=1 Tax=Sphingomonas corticis TaxID=2722791 RepID=A0ABX1CMG4_9SPHN|nr:DUF2059 domain-containing protein [Sphingomonas corticis]NJR79129.1 DUF2059 domain-containing protein [Sphingomonas corticis]
MIVAVAMLAAAPAPSGAAQRIALATVQPPRALAEALAQFDRQFAASFARSGGKAATPVEKKRLARMRAAGRTELSRQLNGDGIPRLVALVERDYRNNYSADELASVAAFWSSPAGAALTRAMQQAAGRGGTLELPAAHRDAITAYLSSAVGRKEAERSSSLRMAMAQEMTAFLQRAQPRISASIAAASTAVPK